MVAQATPHLVKSHMWLVATELDGSEQNIPISVESSGSSTELGHLRGRVKVQALEPDPWFCPRVIYPFCKMGTLSMPSVEFDVRI